MRQGYTIIELVIVLAVAAILAAVGIPRASTLLDGIRVRGATGEIQSLFHATRQTAIIKSRNMTVDIDTASGTLIVRAGNDTTMRRNLTRLHGVKLAATRLSATYSPTGLGFGASNLTLVVSKGAVVDTITVSRLGRVSRR